jgi:DUF4097 and DUF4098 domain-containing protein YvlB
MDSFYLSIITFSDREECMKTVIKQKKRIGLFAILVFFLLTTVGVSAAIEETISKSFDVGPGGQLTVDTNTGSIKVEGMRGDKVEIEIIQNVRTASKRMVKDILDDFQVRFDQDSNDIFVKAEYKRNGFRSFFNRVTNRLQVRFLITVPLEYDVDLHTSGGSISVLDLEGEVLSKTSGGSLTFENITGNVLGKTSGGSIRIGEIRGEVNAQTSGGSIQIQQADGNLDVHTSGGGITIDEAMGSVKASTSGGSVRAYLSRQPEDDCRLTTSGGSITVYLNNDIGLDVDAQTSGGRIYTDFPVKLFGTISSRSLDAQVNGGGPELYLRSSGGSIHLKKK